MTEILARSITRVPVSHGEIREQRGFGLGGGLPPRGHAGPERAMDVVASGEVLNAEDTPRVRGCPVAVTATEDELRSPLQRSPFTEPDHPSTIGSHYYIAQLALRLRKGAVAGTATAEPGDHADTAGSYSCNTLAPRLRGEPINDVVSITTGTTDHADAIGQHNGNAQGLSSASLQGSTSPVTATTSDPASSAMDDGPELSTSEPDFDPPAYEIRPSTPDLDTHRHETSDTESLPKYRKRAILPPLYSLPKNKSVPPAITVAALDARATRLARAQIEASLSRTRKRNEDTAIVQPAGRSVSRLSAGLT